MDPLLLWWLTAKAGGDAGGVPAALTLISAEYVRSTSSSYAVTGTYQSGDLIVIVQSRPNATHPTAPSGYESFLTVSTTNASARASLKVATSSSETINLSGTNSVHTLVFVFSGAAAEPIGDTDTASGNSRTATIDGLTLANAASYVIAIVQTAADSSDGSNAEAPSLPSGLTSVGSSTGEVLGDGGSGYRGMYVGPTGSFTSKSSTVETTVPGHPGDPTPTIRWVTMSIEIRSAS